MEYGLYIDYDWCSGCHACELACKQEHDLKTDQWGIRVVERSYRTADRVTIEYVPIPTEYCNFCMARVKEGKSPACVHHCMTKCMDFGPMEEMARLAAKKKKTVVWGRTY
jgi:Fe-S-cluster-containing dehydrogenase component